MTSQGTTTNLRDLAANLRHIANVLESAECGQLPAPVNLVVNIETWIDYFDGDQAAQQATVDMLAGVIGVRPVWDKTGGTHGWYQARDTQGTWTLSAGTYLKRPMTREQQLAAENERLRDELAAFIAATPVHPTT